MLFKEIVDGRTHARTHGRRSLKDHKSSVSTSCSGELKTTETKFDTFITLFNTTWIQSYQEGSGIKRKFEAQSMIQFEVTEHMYFVRILLLLTASPHVPPSPLLLPVLPVCTTYTQQWANSPLGSAWKGTVRIPSSRWPGFGSRLRMEPPPAVIIAVRSSLLGTA